MGAHFGAMPTRSAPMFAHSGPGAFGNDRFNHFHHRTFILIDAFGFPFFSPFPYDGYYPYGYGLYDYYGYDYGAESTYGYS